VIIEGETGTGKEVLAESLHEMSGSTGPFVVFDCTTVSPSLVEAELFGHERGAFTGAVNSRAGVFEEADGGTLFIDEIGDLELPLQAKLLRAIDRGEVKRVGGNKSIKVQARILSATRRDLDKEVAAGRFRDDLFHRLAVARIELPPLRERTGDIALLARRFAQEMGEPDALSAEVLARFEASAWPGNVRELRNAVARHIALGDDEIARRGAGENRALASTAARGVASTAAGADWLVPLLSLPFPIARRKTLEEFERRYVEGSIAAHGGNVSAAARASGLALRYFRLVKARQSG
jgi:transcriptional regulator with GAF, ATPase, and Fis domain